MPGTLPDGGDTEMSKHNLQGVYSQLGESDFKQRSSSEKMA